jgi:hypothetical protein
MIVMLIADDITEILARQEAMDTLAPTLDQRLLVARTVLSEFQTSISEMAARGRWRSAWRMAKKKREAAREQRHFADVNDRNIIIRRVRR